LIDWFIACKKDWRKVSKISGPQCPLQDDLFNESDIIKQVSLLIKRKNITCNDLFSNTISSFQRFLLDHNLKVIESDKNAGICIVNNENYDEEVFRQLNDTSIYQPSTRSHFELAMIEYKDRLKLFDKTMPEKVKLSHLEFSDDKPARFYILPKVHKPFEHFPKGRPISSTFSKTNKYSSKLLDFLLKPCLNEVSDLLIDTQHFLLLLNNLKLDPAKKYALVTIDVEALYTSLHINDCKKHCTLAYERYITSHDDNAFINKSQFKDLLALSLDYNYVEYNDMMFFQHRGIEMGNSASVNIANLTVFHEIANMFENDDDIILLKRFLDDIFMIVCTENIPSISEWLDKILSHRYLKFTYEHSEKSVSFLDVKVSLDKNNCVCTSLYAKPMNKHAYLQADSDHPIPLKNSLFFSQGLRIVRICSEFSSRVSQLLILYNKFINRGYIDKVLYPCFLKLCTFNRMEALRPKKRLLKDYLTYHNPEIMDKYPSTFPSTQKHGNEIYIVFPYYKYIPSYSKDIVQRIRANALTHCTDLQYKLALDDLVLKAVFSRTNNLKEQLSKRRPK